RARSARRSGARRPRARLAVPHPPDPAMPLTARRLLPAALALVLLLPACGRDAAEAPAAAGAESASADPAARRIEDDVRTLADDRMEGRATGTPGHDLAAAHVAARMAEAGLRPAGDGGTWYQAVPLLRGTVVAEGARLEVRLAGEAVSLAFPDQFLPMAGFDRAEAAVDAPAVFVGQAVHAPDLGHDDFAGLDLRGKVAVMFGGAPDAFDPDRRAFHGALSEKLRAVAARGAVGAVLAGTAADEVRMPWARSAAAWDRPEMRLRGADGRPLDGGPSLQVVARVSASAADTLFAGTTTTAAELADAARAGRARGFDLPV